MTPHRPGIRARIRGGYDARSSAPAHALLSCPLHALAALNLKLAHALPAQGCLEDDLPSFVGLSIEMGVVACVMLLLAGVTGACVHRC